MRPGFLLLLVFIQLAKSQVPEHGILDCPSDINHQDLVGWISEKLNITHLGQFTGQISDQYKGRLCGKYQRPMISLPVKFSSQKCPTINVIFKLETGAGRTTISQKTLQKLRETCPGQEENYYGVRVLTIAGKIFQIGDSLDFYEELNILGTDFFAQTNAHILIDYSLDQMGNVQMKFYEQQDEEQLYTLKQEEGGDESRQEVDDGQRQEEIQMIQ